MVRLVRLIGRRWVGAVVLGLGLAVAVQAAPCVLGWTDSIQSIWVTDDPGERCQIVSNEWAIGTKCSSDTVMCRATFAESLFQQDPTTGQYNWVMGFQGNPVPIDCGTQPRFDSGKINWSRWPSGQYKFTREMSQAGSGGRVVYSGFSKFSVP
jgi:hypothetical protein